MPSIYAKIQNGVVINMQMMETTDTFDPTYTWIAIIITNQVPSPICTDGSQVQIGCTYDGTNFTSVSS